MRVQTSDGYTHPAILTARHPQAGHGVPILILTDTKCVIDSYGWIFCTLVSSTATERAGLRSAGYKIPAD